jgi:hypothetical protein
VIRVLNLTGTTEGLFIGNLWVDREDWHWFAFHPYSGFDFREIQPGVFEHWVHRNEHWPLFQGIFYTFPQDDSVNLKDLYIQHPTKPNLWAFSGRSDDVVVLSNGYKISPLDTEALVTTHPAINGCLMIGTGKTQAGLLIELKDSSARNNEVFDSIWEIVERANSQTFLKTRLQRDYIVFTEPDKPFIRTDKSTIKRRATLDLYASFIDRFYSTRDTEGNAADADAYPVDTSSVETIKESLVRIFEGVLTDVEDLLSDEDVFELGLDSLLVYRVVKIIQHATGLREELAPVCESYDRLVLNSDFQNSGASQITAKHAQQHLGENVSLGSNRGRVSHKKQHRSAEGSGGIQTSAWIQNEPTGRSESQSLHGVELLLCSSRRR